MRRKRLVWHLIPSYLAIVLVAVVVLTAYALHAVHEFHVREVHIDLKARAGLVMHRLETLLAGETHESIDGLCTRLGEASYTRITVIAEDGTIIGDSHEDAAVMENHAERPEIIQALSTGEGSVTRFSHTLQQSMMYVALPLSTVDQTVVIRTSVPLTAVEEALGGITLRIGLGGGAVALLGAFTSLLVAQRISRPIEHIRSAASDLGRGDLQRRVPTPKVEELALLAETLNTMAGELSEKIDSVQTQRNELQAVLQSMAEAVVVFDKQQHVISMNPAAIDLFGVNAEEIRGRTLLEVTRNFELQTVVTRALREAGPVEQPVSLIDGKRLNTHSARFRDTEGNVIGGLTVIHDVTRLLKLETMRRDFVSNVSHELKTPITAIKGFVETLLDGAVEDRENARRFLEIIAKHAERLTEIIDDLLSLSRIEQQEQGKGLEMSESNIVEIVQSAIESCGEQAMVKRIAIRPPENTEARLWVNRRLIEQAVSNLIDNAIRYSDPNTTVNVEVRGDVDEVSIKVTDEGVGIPQNDLERIFERFYRVDESRHGEDSGTGLGLSLVKHIAIVHGGHVSVESELVKGSSFTIHLPS